jgi:c-di-GMP-binding flagellar brake protein YcgR
MSTPTSAATFGTENRSPFQIESRREILALLRGLKEHNQLVSMMINGGSEAFITSVLEVNDVTNLITIDSVQNSSGNQRVVEAPRVFFEGLLDKISIQFVASNLQPTSFDGRPALQFPLPPSLIRLQRREYYRISTPLSNPILCMIPVEQESQIVFEKLPLFDISCGGISVLDEKRTLTAVIGQIYENCQIDLPSIGKINLKLQIRNSQEVPLLNGKTTRRIGCQFIDLSSGVLASIQRYIMKLERERNAKLNGLA